jgi:hypothetical protein
VVDAYGEGDGEASGDQTGGFGVELEGALRQETSASYARTSVA